MSEEHEKYKESAHARIGADRMALGLACIPDGIAGDLAVVSDLRKQRDALLEACQEAADWLCECSPHTDQWERGQKCRRAIALVNKL